MRDDFKVDYHGVIIRTITRSQYRTYLFRFVFLLILFFVHKYIPVFLISSNIYSLPATIILHKMKIKHLVAKKKISYFPDILILTLI